MTAASRPRAWKRWFIVHATNPETKEEITRVSAIDREVVTQGFKLKISYLFNSFLKLIRSCALDATGEWREDCRRAAESAIRLACRFPVADGVATNRCAGTGENRWLECLAKRRRDAQWRVEVNRDPTDLFFRLESQTELPLGQMNLVERLRADYSGTGLSTGPHPKRLIRAKCRRSGGVPICPRSDRDAGEIAGQVTCRQRPGMAKGFVFISLEDETGVSNATVTPQLFERFRLLITEEPFLGIEGVTQNMANVIHVKARKIEALQFRELALSASHDFR